MICSKCGMPHGNDTLHGTTECKAYTAGRTVGMEHAATVAEYSSDRCTPKSIAKRIRRSKP